MMATASCKYALRPRRRLGRWSHAWCEVGDRWISRSRSVSCSTVDDATRACGSRSRGVWRATQTPAGPATTFLRSRDATTIEARAWGDGAGRALEDVADLIGAPTTRRRSAAYTLGHPLARRLSGLRIGRTGAVIEALVPTVLAQRVIGAEACSSHVAMVRAAGRLARGPPTVT